MTTETPTHAPPAPAATDSGRVTRMLETSPFPILLVCLVGIVMLTTFVPSIIVGDTWLTLMAGREVVEHGLPRVDEITILGAGNTWTDQQWLAQLVFYGAHQLAGIRGVVLLGMALVLLALALATVTARTSGASSRSTFLLGFLAVIAGPWGWTIRAQTAALPLFAGVLWLLVDAGRRGIRRRTLLVLPLLVLWANLHGSVVLGAGLTVLLAVVALIPPAPVPAAQAATALQAVQAVPGFSLAPSQAPSPPAPPRSEARPLALALLLLSPLTVLASPYGWDLVAYYELMLIDAPFAEILREWQWSEPSATTSLFWLLAGVTLALLALRRCRSRLTVFEFAVLAVTLIGAIQAVRGVIWFVLASAAILPVALDGLLRRPDVVAPRLNRVISLAALTGLAFALVVTLARPVSWYVREWPEEPVEAVRDATWDPSVRLLATDGTANWLLWRIPDLRGRVAYDVRFEVFDEETLDAIARYGRLEGDWLRFAAGYSVVVVDRIEHLERLDGPDATIVYRGDDSVVIVE